MLHGPNTNKNQAIDFSNAENSVVDDQTLIEQFKAQLPLALSAADKLHIPFTCGMQKHLEAANAADPMDNARRVTCTV